MNPYREIDLTDWPRATHCAVFREHLLPSYCVTAELDITRFLAQVRAQGWSFTLAMTYAACRCAHAVEAFRYRFVADKVVLFDRIDTAFTWLESESELVKVVTVPRCPTMREYVALAAETARRQTAYFTGPLGTDVFQCSALPWVRYTHISHTASGGKDNGTPLFDWGRYGEKQGRTVLPFSVQAHHSFVDGLHIGRLIDGLQAYLDGFDAEQELSYSTE